MDEIELLNQSIRDAEWNRDISFMDNILTDDMLFRRANGSFADKKTYLAGLKDPDNNYNHLENIELKVEARETGNLAIANVIVKASGTRGKDQKPFNGEFRNIRFFRKEKEWKLYAWYNEVIRNHMIIHVPGAEEEKINYKENKEGNMCGKVHQEILPGLPSSPYTRASFVKFDNGAFTKWHYHTGMQILLVKRGTGFVEQKGYPSFDINPGDRIYIPENSWHRHGAKDGYELVHLAITTGGTIWDKADPCT